MDSELGPGEEALAAMNPTDVLTCRLVVLGRVSRHPRDLSFYTARRRTGSMDRWQAAGGRDEEQVGKFVSLFVGTYRISSMGRWLFQG